jgi:hypothetical protein
MVVTRSALDKCLGVIAFEISRVEDVPSKDLYLIGGCGLLQHGVFDKRATDDVDFYYPDASLLPIYSQKFNDSGFTGVIYDFNTTSCPKIAEIFHLIENEVLEDYIIANSVELISEGAARIMLPPLEALVANKVRSYAKQPEREKDLYDVKAALEIQKNNPIFEERLRSLLNSAGLYGKYLDLVGEFDCRSGISQYAV